MPKISIQHLSASIEDYRRLNARTLQDLRVPIAGDVLVAMQAFSIYRGLSAALIHSGKFTLCDDFETTLLYKVKQLRRRSSGALLAVALSFTLRYSC